MAYTNLDNISALNDGQNASSSATTGKSNTITLSAQEGGGNITLPDTSYVTEADMLRDGLDLILQTPEGTVIIEGYFAHEPQPFLLAPEGKTLSPALVDSFLQQPQQYAQTATQNDASPVGAVQEITGEAQIIRTDGTVETIGIGTPIYQGDIIETQESGAVNIMFVDETTFAVSEDARLSIDEYVFDPATQAGTTNFSVLKGMFVFTSGLIGREDPDDVRIDTPSGSIGIRGTIIAGDVNTGEITVIEGAIVLQNFSGQSITLSNQYETAIFNSGAQTIDHIGTLDAIDMSAKYSAISSVSGDLFSSIQDTAKEESQNESGAKNEATDTAPEEGANENISGESDIITSDDITDTTLNNTKLAPDNETNLPDNLEPEAPKPSAFNLDPARLFHPPANNLGEDIPPPTGSLTPPPEPSIETTKNFVLTEFIGAQNSVLSFDISQYFKFPQGQNNSYSIDITAGDTFVTPHIINNNILKMDVADRDTLTADETVTFNITATTSNGLSKTQEFVYNLFDTIDKTGTGIITTGPGSYTSADTSITIEANSVTLFTDEDNANENIIVNGGIAKVKTGGGDDTITINTSAENYTIYGDAGNDTFTISQYNGKIYAGDGNDTLIITGDVATALKAPTSNTDALYDGGSGFDTLKLQEGNIDLSQIDDAIIKNIERIDINNNQANTVTLTYNDVMEMTDNDNRLLITADNQDTINFTNDENNNQFSMTNTTEEFNTYTDGTITLLIDADAAVTGGVLP
ncbi:MAG: FecR domain-containing protein [Alphaproteobacteria bacterium]